MCGRFSLTVTADELAEHYEAAYEGESYKPHYNIAPTAMVPVILNEDPRLIQDLKWGIKYKWMEKSIKGSGMINVRSETALEKPLFKKSFEERRCIIPSTGFYEWKKDSKGVKTPYFIKLKDEKIFSFAGLWTEVKNEKGEKAKEFAILTTSPNDLMKEIHNRMPVIIHHSEVSAWLDTDANMEEIVKLTEPFEAEEMQAYPISAKVNNPRNDFEDLVNPL